MGGERGGKEVEERRKKERVEEQRKCGKKEATRNFFSFYAEVTI